MNDQPFHPVPVGEQIKIGDPRRPYWSVHVTTTNHAAGVSSFGADLMITTRTYAFLDEVKACLCFAEEEARAVEARKYPGVRVDVTFTRETL